MTNDIESELKKKPALAEQRLLLIRECVNDAWPLRARPVASVRDLETQICAWHTNGQPAEFVEYPQMLKACVL